MNDASIKRLLLVEDDRGFARLLREMFKEQGSPDTEVTHVESLSEAVNHLAGHTVDIILLDPGLPDSQGIDTVRQAHAAAPRVPLVVLTGRNDESLALEALQEGAQDYLVKGQIDTRGLLRFLRYAIERNAMEEALFTERERAQVTLKSIGDAVACTDISGNVTFLNVVAERMTGWKAGPWRTSSGSSTRRVTNPSRTSRAVRLVRINRPTSRRTPFSSGVTASRSRSRTLSPPSTTETMARPGQSSCSVTSARHVQASTSCGA